MRRLHSRVAVCACVVAALLAGRAAARSAERPAVERLATAPFPGSRYASLNEVARRTGAALSADELTGVFTLRAGARQVAVTPGIAAVLVGGTLLPLSEEVVVRYGNVYVPRYVAREVEGYLRGQLLARVGPPVTVAPGEPERPEPSRLRPCKRVCIDAGHGGKDPGAVSRWGLREKDVVLSTAELLASELRSRGFEVVMTRESDVFVELEDRPAFAARRDADLFVSIHANAISNSKIHGLEIFYWYGSWTAASAATRRESGALAQAIRQACERNGLDVRSVRGADYKVLRYSRIPATLVEIGFLTNRAEEQALRTRSYRERVARAVADGIQAHCGSAASR